MALGNQSSAEVVGTVATIVANACLITDLWRRRRTPVPETVNVTTMSIRFWPRLIVGVGLMSLIVGTIALCAGGQLNWLTSAGGILAIAAWTIVVLMLRRFSPTTLIYDPDKPGL